MKTYKIYQAYPWVKTNELTIESENLLYTEVASLSGCQSNNVKYNDEIRKKCNQIADLIREIEILNNE